MHHDQNRISFREQFPPLSSFRCLYSYKSKAVVEDEIGSIDSIGVGAQ